MVNAPALRSFTTRSAALLAVGLLGLTAAAGPPVLPVAHGGDVISGPYASLLAASKNLGPSRAGDVQLTVTLPNAERPRRLIEWAGARGLGVRWEPDQLWAIVTGPAEHLASAFDVPVHDFRGRQGQQFYASPLQPALPPELRGEVSAVGRILSYLPHREARPALPLDVPRPGLKPADLLMAYNATPLVEAGYTGQGQTVVIFAFGGFDQRDLDLFADNMELPRFTPEVVGGPLTGTSGETVMDLEVVHAVAPAARLVVVNARPTVEGGGTFEKIGRMFDDTAKRYPHSVWSLSIGWGC